MSKRLKKIISDLINYIYISTKNKTINKRPKLFLHNPYFDNEEIKNLNKCINSTYVATAGEYIKKFENDIKKITKSKDVITVLNGTIALKICLKVLGIKQADEVLVPSLTFVGTVNAIKHAGGDPHFIDSNKDDLGIDYEKLEKYLKKISVKKNNFYYNKNTKKRIFAIMPVHVFGKVNNIEKLKKISKKYNLKIIEDAAEAFGSYYKKNHAGNFGDLGILSFNANKIITTGSGGAILSNSKSLSKKIRHLVSVAKIKHQWEFIHDEVGWNYKLNNLASAVGHAQIKKFKKINNLKLKLKSNYEKNIKKYNNFQFLGDPKYCVSNNWLNTIKIKNINMKERNIILNKINKKNIHCRPIWRLIHKLRMYKNCQRSNLDNAIELEKSVICLPSGAEYGG